MSKTLVSRGTALLAAFTLFSLTSTPAQAGPGTALSFNGTDNYVSATIPAMASNYTVCAWTYLHSGGDLYTTRLGLLTGTNCGSSVEVLIRSQTTNAADPQYLELGRCGYFNGQCSTNPVPLNRWVHLAVSVATNKAVSFYINGAPSGTVTNGAAVLPLGPAIHLGDNVIRKFNGMLDEVQIWSRELSVAEIKQNMHRTPDVADATLAAYWSFDEGVETVAANRATRNGAACNATLVNTPIWLLSVVPRQQTFKLLGANPLTNKCHTAFADPGTTARALPLAIAAGGNFDIVLKQDGTVIAWGDNSYAQTNVPATATNVVAIAAGLYHALALKADGTVVAWGDNSFNQTNVPEAATNIVAIAAGLYHSLALQAGGKVLAWGWDNSGQVTEASSLRNIIAIAAGHQHGLALKSDNTVVGWGNDDYGRTTMPEPATKVVALAGGIFHSVALRANGSVLAWGYNGQGQANVPASATNVVAIAAGENHTIALKADGSVIAWGDNSSNQTNVPAAATNVIAIAANVSVNLALKADGTLVKWGRSSSLPTDVVERAGNIRIPVAVGGTLDTNTTGIYTVDYTATLLSGISALTNRTVVVCDTPGVTGLTASVATNPATGTLRIVLDADVNPNGAAAQVMFAYGLTTNSMNFRKITALPASFTATNANDAMDGVVPGLTCHWYVMAANSMGVALGADQTFTVPMPIAGDLNGDGAVSADELHSVQQNFWQSHPLQMTGLSGVGSGAPQVGVSNSASPGFTVLASTNLVDWEVLTNGLSLRYQINDTNAAKYPQRFYRLRAP